MLERRLDSGFLTSILDASPGLVFVIDESLDITWVNEAGRRLLGYTLEEVLGTNLLDYLDTDWNPEAFQSIATAMNSDGGIRQPMLFRAIAKDGSRPIIEGQANVQLDDPEIRGVVAYARPWTTQWLLDRTLDSVAEGQPVTETLDLLVQIIGSEPMDAPGALLYDLSGDRVGGMMAADVLGHELRGPGAATSDAVALAWRPILADPRRRVHDVANLAEPLRSVAAAAGFRTLWVAPTEPDATDGSTVWAIAWREQERLDADETRIAMMSRVAKVAAFALGRWRAERANAYAAAHDELTGLWNRARLFDYISELIEEDIEHPEGVSVVYLDLDRFKPVNDKFGHRAGDEVLVAVAARLRRVVGDRGRIGRIGGDEFVIAARSLGGGGIDRLVVDIEAALTEAVELSSGDVVSVGVSIGSSFAWGSEATVEGLLDVADRELYDRKRSRRSTDRH